MAVALKIGWVVLAYLCSSAANADDLLDLTKSLQYEKQTVGDVVKSLQKLGGSSDLPNLIAQEYDLKYALQAIYRTDGRNEKAFYCLPGKTCIDDRLDFVDAVSVEQQAANATLLLTRRTNIFMDIPSQGNAANGETTYSIKALSDQMCTDSQVDAFNAEHHTDLMHQRFRDQPMNAGFCTGFKVGPNLVATAGHCVKSDDDCHTISLVAGYHHRKTGDTPNKNIPASQIYTCNKIAAAGKRNSHSMGDDWVIIQTDQPLKDLPTVTLAKPPSIKKADSITVIGYPMGLPSKIAGDAAVLYLANDYFESYVDTFGGNSGSPVFRTEALRQAQLIVEGMLVQGRPDFELTSPCYLAKQYPANSGGEDAAYVATLKNALPP
jgi:V8-like Glu-specific endopeptidase